MALDEVVRKIPPASWEATSEKLIDIVLNSPNSGKMPSGLAKTILYYWQRDQLATEVGLQRLLEASTMLEPEKTLVIFRELHLPEVVTVLENR